ncbi:hypothetical protein O181_082073 [Austropuccinia psidii MF-1]|uniref:Uncharacterized protein n=1 Tax=Austropuccinia psidii MF-1 TaxID=1389203 RepID=A0A9Q3FLS6_9BASI|nr:hypothetical protein [Austropuccinia psidii MF-1]
MTPTRSGSNYSIQANGSGPGHSSHKSKRKECQPRGEAQMEDARPSTSSQRDRPVSVQELIYGSKRARVGTSPKSLDRRHELISSSEEIYGARKDSQTSEGLDTHVLHRKSPTDKSLVEKPKYVIRRPEEEVGPRQGTQPSGSSPSLHKCPKSPSQPQKPTRRARNRQRGRQSPNGTSLTHRITGSPRKKRQPWTMCSIWQEL